MRLWVPELEGIKGGDAHIPWTLNSAVLSHAQVQLGETYPNPIVIAPEWSRHTKKVRDIMILVIMIMKTSMKLKQHK